MRGLSHLGAQIYNEIHNGNGLLMADYKVINLKTTKVTVGKLQRPPPFPKIAVEGHNFYKVWIGQYYEPYALHVSFLFNSDVLNYYLSIYV